ncbi:uncharacterized protein N7482_010699 [Penicillium canariense]|uniref:Uncharacterized protein n=1 Tax=Penicillium canariense TaxID=189055 RepID=A0A9W9LEK9_9EURO|nr:uncharacterized protein N7482_010699 [Penicillium canariense]KAJ5151447.1 hypothetical protein N7482_010699 [Penicillium canariense]
MSTCGILLTPGSLSALPREEDLTVNSGDRGLAEGWVPTAGLQDFRTAGMKSGSARSAPGDIHLAMGPPVFGGRALLAWAALQVAP